LSRVFRATPSTLAAAVTVRFKGSRQSDRSSSRGWGGVAFGPVAVSL
jgi:hypothetical protein